MDARVKPGYDEKIFLAQIDILIFKQPTVIILVGGFMRPEPSSTLAGLQRVVYV